MKIGIATNCFSPDMPTEGALTEIKLLGARTVSIGLSTFYEYRPEFAKKYAPMLEGLRVGAVTSSPCNFESQLFDFSRRVRGDGLYWLDQVIRSCQIFGAERYVFRGVNLDGASYTADRAAEFLGGINEICGRYKIKLSLCNSFAGLLYRPGIFAEIRARQPDISAAFDLREAQRSGYPYSMFLKDMRGSIDCVYLSDSDGDGRQCLPGEGKTYFKEVFARLKSEGFHGDVFIGCGGRTGESLRRSLQYLHEAAKA